MQRFHCIHVHTCTLCACDMHILCNDTSELSEVMPSSYMLIPIGLSTQPKCIFGQESVGEGQHSLLVLMAS